MPPRKFKSRRLRRFYERDQKGTISDDLAPTVREMLSMLNRAQSPEDMDRPGWGFKEMKGDMAGVYRVEVNKKWRILFE